MPSMIMSPLNSSGNFGQGTICRPITPDQTARPVDVAGISAKCRWRSASDEALSITCGLLRSNAKPAHHNSNIGPWDGLQIILLHPTLLPNGRTEHVATSCQDDTATPCWCALIDLEDPDFPRMAATRPKAAARPLVAIVGARECCDPNHQSQTCALPPFHLELRQVCC